ncbi:hypothetical protein [Mucilaginibacter boryungensis]|uniref:Uncharacterized protein n=1 Tax=Mucilaginibacter boryungensis TaxID=768480 RepID=A0ABR9XGC1_9SPHI|nr:hypothetical protein [Mucilaginibacter boryungensis]MBE9666240.1 hypothetical protein [Mucilaginibacter boryungensis]
MTPLKAFLETEISGTFDYLQASKITEIVNLACNERTTSDLDFLKRAKSEIEKYLLETARDSLKSMNEKLGYNDYSEIEGLKVNIECKPLYGNPPVPEFHGNYKFYAKSVEIGVLQFFENQTIAYHTEEQPQVRFCKLDKTVTCYIIKNFWDSEG